MKCTHVRCPWRFLAARLEGMVLPLTIEICMAMFIMGAFIARTFCLSLRIVDGYEE